MRLTVKKFISIGVVLSIGLLAVACNNTQYQADGMVVEAEVLNNLPDNAVVIDARSDQDYQKGHVVGAINITPREVTVDEPVEGSIAPKEQVAAVFGQKGISDSMKVYIYDNNDGVSAARLWWVMKCYGNNNAAVINGGESAIVKAKVKLTVDVVTLPPTEYQVKELDKNMVATVDDVVAVVEGKEQATLLDVRSRSEFDEGAIPTAVLYPHVKNLYKDGTFKSSRDIYLDYNDLGLKKKEPVILYCKSSFRAAQTALLLEQAGYEQVKIYDGAWNEWATKDVPQEKTEEKVAPSSGDGS